MLRAGMSIGIVVSMAFANVPGVLVAQSSDSDEAREQAVYERFVSVLEKNPRRGTAFDKVYAYHVERGSVEALLKSYKDRTATSAGPDSAPLWMIIGLIEARRAQDAAAAEAFGKAERLDPSSAMAAFYLGQSLVAQGQS